MRILLVLAVLAAACGSKKPPASPTPPAATDDTSKDGDMKDEKTPDDPDEMRKETGADPCDGGE
jgi:hypothetical protein